MEYRTLNNGVRMPVLGLGTWDLRGDDCVRAVGAALRMGYELVDTAAMYQNEREVGLGIRESGVPRERVFVTIKVFRPDNSYEGTAASLRRSLKLMGLDYLDLVLIHEPYAEARRPIFADPTLRDVASAHGCTTGQVALRYLLQSAVMVVACHFASHPIWQRPHLRAMPDRM